MTRFLFPVSFTAIHKNRPVSMTDRRRVGSFDSNSKLIVSLAACQLAQASPCGTYIASLTLQHLYVQFSQSLAPAYTFSLETQPSGKRSIAEISTIKWSSNSTHLLLVSANAVVIFSLYDASQKITITNGSGSLGRIVSAELVGPRGNEQALVTWEFGRVGLWDLRSGKAVELGESKSTGRATLSVRRQRDRTEIVALLSRVAAADVVSLYLPPQTTALRSFNPSTQDAQVMTWSPCGKWLAILDSALASPSVHIYTSDGYAYRTYPARAQTSESNDDDDVMGLRFRSMAWSVTTLALIGTNSMTLLDSRTFSFQGTLHTPSPQSNSTPSEDHLIGYQEIVTASAVRSYTFLTSETIPSPSSTSLIIDVQFNVDGTLMLSRDSNATSSVTIWSVPNRRSEIVVLQHSPIRKALWHPSRSHMVLLLSEDSTVYYWDIESQQPPVPIQHSIKTSSPESKIDAQWMSSEKSRESPTVQSNDQEEKLAILLSSRKNGWQILWPKGRPEDVHQQQDVNTPYANEEGDVTQDSLYEILTGRTPLPELKNAVKTSDETSASENLLEDTFREKKAQLQPPQSIEDDPDIF